MPTDLPAGPDDLRSNALPWGRKRATKPGLTAPLMGKLAATALAWLVSGSVLADQVHVDQAVAMLRAGCEAGQASIDMQQGTDGRLYLQLKAGEQTRGSTHLVHGDLERFTDITLRLQAQQSTAASGCMGQAVNRIIGTLLSLPPDVASLPPARPAVTVTSGAYVPPMMSQPAPIAPPAPAPAPAAVIASVVSPVPATGFSLEAISGRWVGLAECRRDSYPVSMDVRGTSVVELQAEYSDSLHNSSVKATLIALPATGTQSPRLVFRTDDDRWIVMKNGHQLQLNSRGNLVSPDGSDGKCTLVLSKV